MAHGFNLSTWDVEACGSLVQGQSHLQRDFQNPLLKNQRKIIVEKSMNGQRHVVDMEHLDRDCHKSYLQRKTTRVILWRKVRTIKYKDRI